MFLFFPITLKTNNLRNNGIYKSGFFTQQKKRKLIPTALPILLSHKYISTPRKTSEITEKQKEKEQVKI